MANLHALKNALFSQISESRFKLTAVQGLVLQQVRTQAVVSVSSLAKLLNTTPSAMTQIVTGLTKQGLLKQTTSSHDKRKKTLSLTHKAEAVIAAHKKAKLKMLNRAFAKLTNTELQQLNRLISKATQTH
jgi:DNA-binding MarR family transcriptional regulator